MLKIKIKLISTLMVFLALSCSCKDSIQKSRTSTVTVATWNVQNLFDSTDDGTEYSEYLTTTGWTEKAYKKKLSNISTVFSYFQADIVVLNEIENKRVLQDLCSIIKNYPYYTCAGQKNGAIQTAIVSRYPINKVVQHEVENTRPVLQATIQSPNGEINLFAVHAKSRKEGTEETAKTRLNLGLVLKQVAQNSDNTLSIIAGDFNEETQDNNIFCDVRLQNTDAPIKVCSIQSSQYWYNQFLDTKWDFDALGTYYYNGRWFCYDNILIYNSQDWEITDAKIIFQGILKNANNTPNAYDRALLTGVSDHLPVTLTLTY